jgi:hypothetical protein
MKHLAIGNGDSLAKMLCTYNHPFKPIFKSLSQLRKGLKWQVR